MKSHLWAILCLASTASLMLRFSSNNAKFVNPPQTLKINGIALGEKLQGRSDLMPKRTQGTFSGLNGPLVWTDGQEIVTCVISDTYPVVSNDGWALKPGDSKEHVLKVLLGEPSLERTIQDSSDTDLLGESSTDVEKVETTQVDLQLIYPDLSLAIYFADEKIERLVIASDIRTLSGSDIVRQSNSFQI